MSSTTVPTTSRYYESFPYDILFHHFFRNLSSIDNSARSFVRERDQGYPKCNNIHGELDTHAVCHRVLFVPLVYPLTRPMLQYAGPKNVVYPKLGHKCEFSFLDQTNIAISSVRSKELAA